MPSKPKGSVSEETGEEAGLTHLFGCTGRSPDGSPCPAWVPTWLPKLVPRGFMERPFLCGFCAAEEVAKLKTNSTPNDEASKLFSLLQSDANEQYGRRHNILIFGLEESPDEGPYQAVLDVANMVGVEIQKSYISVCHRVPSRKGKRPLIVKFVRRQKKFELMSSKKKLRDSDSNVYLNEDFTFLRAKLAAKLRQKADIKAVSMQNERVVIYTDDGKGLAFENICDLYTWDQSLVLSACKEHLNF